MVGERLRLVPQRMANDPGCGSRASDPQGTSEEGRQARLTRPSKIHFHLIWRSNLSQTIAFALLLGGILLITHFRNGTGTYVLLNAGTSAGLSHSIADSLSTERLVGNLSGKHPFSWP